VACQVHNGLRPDQHLIWYKTTEQGTIPNVTFDVSRYTCMQCADAGCVRGCPTGALYSGDSGLTHYDSALCSGCAYCTQTCPFGVPKVEGGRALRCTGCSSLVSRGEAPACVSACIANALSYGPREEMLKKAEARVAELRPRWRDAQVYSPAGVGGTSLIWVLRCRPAMYGLPDDPKVSELVTAWKQAVQPAGLAATVAALLVGGIGYFFARRNHVEEMNEEVGRHGN
jgi:formate dehydrogenase iron-sulfur subunit